jgi:hypothetical protein
VCATRTRRRRGLMVVSPFLACIGSLCLRHCVHGVPIGGEVAGHSGVAFWMELLSNFTVAFVGCSLEGGYLGKMLRAAHRARTNAGAPPRHFAIMGGVTPQLRRQHEAELGVAVLGYAVADSQPCAEDEPDGLLAYLERMRATACATTCTAACGGNGHPTHACGPECPATTQ